MMGDPLGSSRVSSQKQNCEGVVGAQSGQYRHEAFWELTSFEFHRNSEVKRVARESNPMMGDPLGSSRVSSQKQNREGVVGAQSGQYRATVVEWAREVVRPGPGCDNAHLIPTVIDEYFIKLLY
ncbi:unnamed protein product [Malus baccata var. baccata]